MLSKNELITLSSLLNRCNLNQLYAAFDFIINYLFEDKLSSEEYNKFLKSINRL